MPTAPLVSCILLAGQCPNDIIHQSIRCFKKQAYKHKELIIVNNANTQTEAGSLLIEQSDNIRIVDTPQKITAGLAKNIGIYHSKGQIIAQWNANYWYDPKRLTGQLTAMGKNDSGICVLAQCLKYSQYTGEYGYYTTPKNAILSTLIFARSKTVEYPHVDNGEEVGILLSMLESGMKIISLDIPHLACRLYRTSQPAKCNKKNAEFLDNKKAGLAISRYLEGC